MNQGFDRVGDSPRRKSLSDPRFFFFLGGGEGSIIILTPLLNFSNIH